MSNDRAVFSESKEDHKQQILYTGILKSTFNTQIRFYPQVVIIREGVLYQTAA
jgi:hypothetical protein